MNITCLYNRSVHERRKPGVLPPIIYAAACAPERYQIIRDAPFA